MLEPKVGAVSSSNTTPTTVAQPPPGDENIKRKKVTRDSGLHDADENELIEKFTSRLLIFDEESNKYEDDPNFEWIPEEDYYVHIDVLQGSSPLVSSRINSYMIRKDSYDPRRAHNFPTELMDPNTPDNPHRRRHAVGMGESYYEMWKVRRKEFKVTQFREMVEQELPKGTIVRLVPIIDNEHEITVWGGAQ